MDSIKVVQLDDILETIEICESVIVARQEAASNDITADKSQSYILEKTREIEKLAHIITGIHIVKHSIEKIYKEEEV